MTERQKRSPWRTIAFMTDFWPFMRGGRYDGDMKGKRFHPTDADLEPGFGAKCRIARAYTLPSEWMRKARDGQPMDDGTERMRRDGIGRLAKEAQRTTIDGPGNGLAAEKES